MGSFSHPAAIFGKVLPAFVNLPEALHSNGSSRFPLYLHLFRQCCRERPNNSLYSPFFSATIRCGGPGLRNESRKLLTAACARCTCFCMPSAVCLSSVVNKGKSTSNSEYPSIAVNGLLISCAAPAANRPSAVNFCDCATLLCTSLRFSTEACVKSTSRSSSCASTFNFQNASPPRTNVAPNTSRKRKLAT